MAKLVRTVLLALLASLLVGFAIGTVIRLRMEAPHPGYFIGSSDAAEAPALGSAESLGGRPRMGLLPYKASPKGTLS